MKSPAHVPSETGNDHKNLLHACRRHLCHDRASAVDPDCDGVVRHLEWRRGAVLGKLDCRHRGGRVELRRLPRRHAQLEAGQRARLRRSMQNETADQASRRGDVRYRLASGDVKQGHASFAGGTREEAMLKGSLGLIALSSLLLSGAALAQEKIKVGVTATLEGTYTVLGEDGIRGHQTALNVLGKKIGDKELEFIIASTDATPDSAIRAVRKLIEQDKVQILLSPLSGDEGIAVKNFAKTHPELTFINAASGAQETTFLDPAPNFFRYNMDGAQWQVGLGKYAYDTKGYRKIATIGEDHSFVYTQVFGLVLEFCGAGGQVTNRQWVPLGTKDFASVIAALPDDADAIYLGLGGADAVNFLNQYQQAGGKAHLMGGSIMIDQTILSSKGNAKNAL